MENIKTRTYRLDGDELETVFKYDEDFGIWVEEYVDFESVPRFTPNGRRWRSVTTTDCIYSDPEFRDCGTCPYLCKERSEDLIGVCFNERLRENSEDTAVRSEIKSINIQKGVEL
ncbi:MAG: hypothetical protein II987_06840 [Clostridia bacterium]|nr:hypothetical protein [Clostridia bacterium]